MRTSLCLRLCCTIWMRVMICRRTLTPASSGQTVPRSGKSVTRARVVRAGRSVPSRPCPIVSAFIRRVRCTSECRLKIWFRAATPVGLDVTEGSRVLPGATGFAKDWSAEVRTDPIRVANHTRSRLVNTT
uniref:(northern house mosquito) hypothetical protein n=1 Tax=Culex pipiens TaxID=7175 RepID=A0A8D8CS29_CULPI